MSFEPHNLSSLLHFQPKSQISRHLGCPQEHQNPFFAILNIAHRFAMNSSVLKNSTNSLRGKRNNNVAINLLKGLKSIKPTNIKEISVFFIYNSSSDRGADR